MSTLLKLLITSCVVFSQLGCSLNMKIFGKTADLSSTAPISTGSKGSFPLGEPKFTGAFKENLRAAPGKRFVFSDFYDDLYVVTDSGSFITKFTPTNLKYVTGIAVDSSANIYVTGSDTTDPNNIRYLQKYDINGNFLGNLVTYGFEAGWGGVPSPASPVVAPDGTIYLIAASEIRKYNAAGTQIGTIGGQDPMSGTTDGLFQGIATFTLTADGSIYTAEYWNNRLQKFDASGNYVSQFSWPRQITNSAPTDLQYDENGNFAITESLNNSGYLIGFDSTGALKWLSDGSENGSAAFTGDYKSITRYNDKYYVGFRDQVYVYNADGSYFTKYQKLIASASSVTRSKDGSFFIGAANGIFKYGPLGDWQATFGISGGFVLGVAVSSSNILYVIDVTVANKIFKYDLLGNSLGFINVPAMSMPYGMTIDKDDNLFVADAVGGILKIPTSTETSAVFGSGYSIVTGITVATDGSIVVIDSNGATTLAIRRYNSAGALIQSFTPSGAGALTTSLGLTTTSNGRIYVNDSVGNKVKIYEADGTYVTSFGSSGVGYDKFNMPTGIYADSNDDIFVADNGNNFVKKFTSAGVPSLE